VISQMPTQAASGNHGIGSNAGHHSSFPFGAGAPELRVVAARSLHSLLIVATWQRSGRKHPDS